VITKRHAKTFFDLFEPERRAINQLLDGLRKEMMSKDVSVSGFNIGMNNGDTAGQTIAHAHVHLIPRRQGDVQDPRRREGRDTGQGHLLNLMPIYWLCYRHNNQISVVIEPGASHLSK
jgi:diadenosine tetraphosphate (Ap4A) HIT family hydrolase